MCFDDDGLFSPSQKGVPEWWFEVHEKLDRIAQAIDENKEAWANGCDDFMMQHFNTATEMNILEQKLWRTK